MLNPLLIIFILFSISIHIQDGRIFFLTILLIDVSQAPRRWQLMNSNYINSANSTYRKIRLREVKWLPQMAQPGSGEARFRILAFWLQRSDPSFFPHCHLSPFHFSHPSLFSISLCFSTYGSFSFFFLFFLIKHFFLLLFNYSCLHFLPTPPGSFSLSFSFSKCCLPLMFSLHGLCVCI